MMNMKNNNILYNLIFYLSFIIFVLPFIYIYSAIISFYPVVFQGRLREVDFLGFFDDEGDMYE